MLNLYEKGRIPSEEKEILTKSFLIDKIANEMKLKYKKVFSFINYDEDSLKNDIHFLLSKYISNNRKEINIKYIETTLLNKVREKYRRKSPFKIKKNLYDKNLIKVVNTSSKKNVYIKKDGNKEKKIKNKLPVIKNKNDFILPKIYNKYSGTYDNLDKNEKQRLYEINKKINDLEKEEEKMKEEINKEKDEIKILEQYKKDIQKQIEDINKEMEKEKENQQNEELLNNNNNDVNNHIEINDHNAHNNMDSKEEEYKEKYLERKQNIEDDYYNKENKYTFLKPYPNENDNNKSINTNSRRPFRYNNIKVNNNSTDNMRKKYLKNRILEINQENNNRYENDMKNNYSFSNYIDNNQNNNHNNKNDNKLRTISYEERMQLKVLQRSLAQEKAFNNLRNILSPEKEFLSESKYQGFNNKNKSYEDKNRKLKMVDKARRIQLEKMMKQLDESILEKEKRKKAEKEFDRKYREINEKTK